MSNVDRASASELIKDELPFTTMCNEAINLIKKPDALAIWAYLQTKPPSWVVRPTEIQKHFGIGRDRYLNAMRHLREIGMVTIKSPQDEQGRMKGRRIHIHCRPQQQTEALETRSPGIPPDGKTDPLVSNDLVSKNLEPQNPSPTASNEDLDAAFDIFWTAGLRKDAKKKARAAFARLVKGKDAAAFAERLAEDIRRRVAAGQLGIDRMLPTTYLNGERWEDEAPEVCPHAEILDAWNAEMPDHIEKLTPDDWLPDSKGFQRLAAAWENFKTKPRTTTGRPVFTRTEDGVDFYREVFRRMSLVDRIQRADAASWCKLSWAVQQDVTIKAFKGELV